jgi:hypothetical protein
MTRRRWWLLAGVVALLWLIAAVVVLVGAARHLQDGRDAARRARDRVDAESIADGSAVPDVRAARDEFRAAARSTGNPVLVPLRALPVVGRQLRSVHALSSAARDVSDAALDALTRAHTILEEPTGGGPARVAEIRSLEKAITSAATRVRAVDDLGPRAGLLRPLADARVELAQRLADARSALDDAAAGARAGRRLLEGPRRYLLVAANNAEMRAGSGMWLMGGVLTTGGGRLQLGDVAPLYRQANPPEGAVPIKDTDLRKRWDAAWPHVANDWRSLMVSPRMPASAELGEAMWRAAGKAPIDGVLVVDPVALAAVVRATGAVSVNGEQLGADDIVPTLLNRQYQRFGADSVRRDLLGTIAHRAFDALDAGDWAPATLAGELARAAAGRHVLAWSIDPLDERGWAAAGVSGQLSRDSLLVSLLNRGVNKLDWFLQTSGRISTIRKGSSTEVKVHLTFRNATPAGQPAYVTGPPDGEHWPPSTYIGVAAVDVPAWATHVRMSGVGPLGIAGADGPAQVVAGLLVIPPGESREVTVVFRGRGHRGRIAVESSARVPGITWHYGARTWQDSERRTANWDVG